MHFLFTLAVQNNTQHGSIFIFSHWIIDMGYYPVCYYQERQQCRCGKEEPGSANAPYDEDGRKERRKQRRNKGVHERYATT